jgi:methionyl-tRNA formyltransferase
MAKKNPKKYDTGMSIKPQRCVPIKDEDTFTSLQLIHSQFIPLLIVNIFKRINVNDGQKK